MPNPGNKKNTLSSDVDEYLLGLKSFSRICTRRWQWHPTPVLLPGKSHGQRSLVGCSPWGREESDTTERLHFHFSLSCIGEGNGNPLQCSCLENPRNGGACWAAVYGVAQSRTRLKWLSSTSSSRICTSWFHFTVHWLELGNISILGPITSTDNQLRRTSYTTVAGIRSPSLGDT